VRGGDAIVLLASSGVQTNGLTLCRALAERLPDGYLTKMADGRTYGEALLDPSVIYVKFVAAAQRAGVDLHYAAHVTGHGCDRLVPRQRRDPRPRHPPNVGPSGGEADASRAECRRCGAVVVGIG